MEVAILTLLSLAMKIYSKPPVCSSGLYWAFMYLFVMLLMTCLGLYLIITCEMRTFV